MPFPTKTSCVAAIFVAASYSIPACAQDNDGDMNDGHVESVPMSDLDAETIMQTSDIDMDGALNAEEFVAFTVAMAKAGDEEAKALVITGDYDAAFAARDTDLDGELSDEELFSPSDSDSDPMTEGGDSENPIY